MSLTIDDFLDIWRKSFDSSYTLPLENEIDGLGLDVIAAVAAVFERAAEASEVTTQSLYILPHSIQTRDPASGAVKSTGVVTVTREPPAYGPVELETADPLLVEILDTAGEYQDEITIDLDQDQTFADGDTTPTNVNVRAIRAGFQGNVPDTAQRQVVFKRRTVLEIENATTVGGANTIEDTGTFDQFDGGMVGSFVRFTTGPNLLAYPRRIIDVAVGTSTTTVTVDGPALAAGALSNTVEVIDVNDLPMSVELDGAISGGAHGWLDVLGKERDIGRNANESDTVYRDRIRALPDTIAPNAITRACSRILRPLSIPFLFLESRTPEDFAGIFFDDAPFDDPYASILRRGELMLDSRFAVQGFFVVVERRGTGDFGIPLGTAPPGGVHPFNAFDGPGASDGYPIGFWATLEALIAEVEKTRGAGVPWLLVIVDSLP